MTQAVTQQTAGVMGEYPQSRHFLGLSGPINGRQIVDLSVDNLQNGRQIVDLSVDNLQNGRQIVDLSVDNLQNGRQIVDLSVDNFTSYKMED
ncbi:hypothetical protein BgiBS90_011492 [Biomphalaria glabrata]|nr:hypothetical protein BgiBS90_011492 [Biomphalaria glabrata]